MPTGVGKTVLFTEVTEALNEQEILETMIVVPTKILVDQTAERFHQFAPDLQVGKLYSDAHDATRPVTITTYASLVRHIEDGTLDAQLYKLLVLDEVHRSLSGKRSQAVVQFTNAIKLGFTATPMYSEDRNVANLLNTEIHKMTIREAVEENLLSPFSAIIAETEVDLTDISIKGNGDYDDKELEEAINIQSRNQAAVDLYQKLFQGQTAVAYCVSVKHAQDLAKLFTENGVTADFVSGYQDKKEQAETLRRYHAGEIKVLCNADLLIEGFDEPKASVCLNLRPTKSVVVAQQRAGRVLRLDPDNPNKHAVIVDFLDKTDDPRKLSVTFAEVAEAATILVKKKAAGGSVDVGDPTPGVDRGGHGINIIDENEIQISGLKVITNPTEVMRIVKEMEDKRYLKIQDTDFPLTFIFGGMINKTFIGESTKLKSLVNMVVEMMKAENQNLVTRRKSGNITVSVVTDKQRFIEEMEKLGAQIRRLNMVRIKGTDFPITTSGRGLLDKTFMGDRRKLKSLADEVVKKLKAEDENLVARRVNGSHTVTVVTDKTRFIEEIKKLGIHLTSDVETLQEVQPSDLELTASMLRTTFTGEYSKLRSLMEHCVDLLKNNEPELIVQRKKGYSQIRVVTDKSKFIEMMVDLGATLQDQEILEVQESDFPLSVSELTKVFIGQHHYTRRHSLEVLEYFKKTEPDLIVERGNKNRRLVTAISDREKFIEQMLLRGAELRTTTN